MNGLAEMLDQLTCMRDFVPEGLKEMDPLPQDLQPMDVFPFSPVDYHLRPLFGGFRLPLRYVWELSGPVSDATLRT